MVQFSEILPVFDGRILTTSNFTLRLLHKIGQGSFGVVYIAEEVSTASCKLPSRYAVKCLLRHPDGSDYACAQEREAHMHKAVSEHPNVVRLHDIVIEERYVFHIMDYCPGGDLFNAIVDRAIYIYNDAAIKKTFVQLINAVEACHDLGICHRDLKPENILCSDDYRNVRISDFGLATQMETSHTFGCGSMYSMSPECIGIMTGYVPYATRPSDVWSLGVILNNMITGRNPWYVASPVNDEGFRQYLLHGAPFLRSALPISWSAALLLQRIFDPDPSTRITLPQLRDATLKVDTFFSEPQTCVQCAVDASVRGPYAHYYDMALVHAQLDTYPPANVPPSPENEVHSSSSSSLDCSADSTTMQIHLSSFPAPPALDPTSRRPSSGSEADSGGPITPPISSQEPTILAPYNEIPELSLTRTNLPKDAQGRQAGPTGLRGNRKKIFAGIGSGIGLRNLSGTGSRLSRKIRQYRIGKSATRFVGVVRELKLRT